MINTVLGSPVSEELVQNYFKRLVNSFFKILPMREECDETLPVYIKSLQIELLGTKGFICGLSSDADFMTLISILQFLADNPTTDIPDVRREVFKAISFCNKLKYRYAGLPDMSEVVPL